MAMAMAASSIHHHFHTSLSSKPTFPNSTTHLIFSSSLWNKSKSKPKPNRNFPSIITFNSSSVTPIDIDKEDEDSKFVPLNPDDPKFGPPALLLLGFKQAEEVQLKQLLKELDGEFLRIIFCTEDMISRSLWDAVNWEENDKNSKELKITDSSPRICFLSGLTGEEMMMFIDAFEENSGLESAVFAAVVPNSADKPLIELVDEIMGDHEMVTKQSQAESMGA